MTKKKTRGELKYPPLAQDLLGANNLGLVNILDELRVVGHAFLATSTRPELESELRRRPMLDRLRKSRATSSNTCVRTSSLICATVSDDDVDVDVDGGCRDDWGVSTSLDFFDRFVFVFVLGRRSVYAARFRKGGLTLPVDLE